MSARSRTKTRGKRAAPLLAKAFGGALLTVGLFYIGWFATTEAQTYKILPSLTASASSTPEESASDSSSTTTPATSNIETSVPITSAPADPYTATYATGSEVVIDGNTIDVALSTTTAAIDEGLQDRPKLGANDGMLFVFKKASIYQFWMPNMSFSLDMIWIGSDHKIVDISRDAPPLSDPSKPVWFRPSAPAQYVLEVNANYASSHNIKIGDTVQFVSIPL